MEGSGFGDEEFQWFVGDGLFQAASQLGKELIRSHTYRTGQLFFVPDVGFDRLGDVERRFEKKLGLGDVEVTFVDGGLFHERGILT